MALTFQGSPVCTGAPLVIQPEYSIRITVLFNEIVLLHIFDVEFYISMFV